MSSFAKISLCALGLMCASTGCHDSGVADDPAEAAAEVGPERAAEDRPQLDPPPAESASADSAESSYLEQVTSLYQEAKAAGNTTASNAATWLSDLYGNAMTTGTDVTQNTMDQLGSLYETAKERGETSATSARDWVLEDLRNHGAFEYKALELASRDASEIEAKLNELGSQRWDCFWVEQRGSRTIFYFKRTSKSYLHQLPARELLRLLPLIGTGGDDSATQE